MKIKNYSATIQFVKVRDQLLALNGEGYIICHKGKITLNAANELGNELPEAYYSLELLDRIELALINETIQ